MTLSLPIATRRLRLRAFVPSDLEALDAYHGLPDAARYLDRPTRDRGETRAALDAMCSQVALNRPGDTLALAVERPADGALAGHVRVRWHDATAGQAELVVILNPTYRCQGYALEAARAAMALGFEHFNFHRMFGRCDARNRPAARLMKRLGMRLEAHYREHAMVQGEWDEELHFAMLSREWLRPGKVRELTHLVA